MKTALDGQLTRPKALSIPQPRPRLRAHNNMRLDKRALRLQIAHYKLRARLDRLFYHTHDVLRRCRVEQTAQTRARIGVGVAGVDGGHGGFDAGDEGSGDCALDDYAFGADAGLSAVYDGAGDDAARRGVDVGVVEHLWAGVSMTMVGVRWAGTYNRGCLSAELEHARLEVLRGLGCEYLPDTVASRELDKLMSEHGSRSAVQVAGIRTPILRTEGWAIIWEVRGPESSREVWMTLNTPSGRPA